MAEAAQSSVLVPSSFDADARAFPVVGGPTGNFQNMDYVLGTYSTIGFQAAHFGQACTIAKEMLRPQLPSRVWTVTNGEAIEVPCVSDEGQPIGRDDQDLVYPTIFLGMVANLFGTGCREAVRFLVQEGIVLKDSQKTDHDGERALDCRSHIQHDFDDLRMTVAHCGIEHSQSHTAEESAVEQMTRYRSFLGAVVVSGGGMEHDIRRACEDYYLGTFASEGTPCRNGSQSIHLSEKTDEGKCRFGNVLYPSDVLPTVTSSGNLRRNGLYYTVVRLLVECLVARQVALKGEATSKPIPEEYADVCTWALTPSEMWALAGWILPDIMEKALVQLYAEAPIDGNGPQTVDFRTEALQRAQSTVLYWAARQNVPIYSPSISDGDIMHHVLDVANGDPSRLLQIDLVRDIHSLNKLAMLSKCSGMIICGGGVVKHHVCNANLMRNGADYTIVINTGQEFDGSDAGARPDEARSWGKIRLDGKAVKVYCEATIAFPLMVGQAFVPAVRERTSIPQ